MICSDCLDEECKNVNEHCSNCMGVNTEWIDIDGVPYIWCNDCDTY